MLHHSSVYAKPDAQRLVYQGKGCVAGLRPLFTVTVAVVLRVENYNNHIKKKKR